MLSWYTSLIPQLRGLSVGLPRSGHLGGPCGVLGMCARLEGNTQKIRRIYHAILRSMAVDGWVLVLKGSGDSSGVQQAVQAREVCRGCVLPVPSQHLSRSMTSVLPKGSRDIAQEVFARVRLHS